MLKYFQNTLKLIHFGAEYSAHRFFLKKENSTVLKNTVKIIHSFSKIYLSEIALGVQVFNRNYENIHLFKMLFKIKSHRIGLHINMQIKHYAMLFEKYVGFRKVLILIEKNCWIQLI